jgi:hypothetical protein
MRARTVLVVLTALLCAGLVWFSVDNSRRRAAAATQLAVARERQARLSAELRQAEKTVVPPPAPSAAKAPMAAVAPKAAPARPAVPGLLDLARDNPQLLKLFVASQRARLQQRYGVLFQDLPLGDAAQAKFKDVMTAHAERSGDIGVAAREQGVPLDDPAIKKLRDDSTRQMETELRALLGEAGFKAYQEFERAVPVRGFVDGFAVQVASSDPLTPRQAEQLARALVAASPSFQKGAAADPATLDWAAVDHAAQGFLSPAQFTAWKLGIAHNPSGGSRATHELKKIYDAAVAKTLPPKP